MLLSRRRLSTLAWCLAAAAAIDLPLARAAEDDFVGSGNPGHGTVAFRVELYDNPDQGDGNPFLDESLTVVEPAIVLDYDVSDRLSAHGQLTYDYVSSASIKRLSRYPEQSGASGDYYVGLDLGLNYQLSERTRAGGFVNGSAEYDYTSFGLGGSLSRDSEDHARTLTLSTNGYFDLVKVIRFDGSDDEGTDQRISWSGSLAWYQVINRSTHAELGANLTYQTGFLETAFNSVVIEDPGLAPNPVLENLARGYEVAEELPGTRVRGAVYGQLRRSLHPRWSVGMLGRLYSDSWGIGSYAVEPQLYHWLVPELLNVRLRYRYYSQTGADAFASSFTEVRPERTQDSDLGPFHSHGMGVRLEFGLHDAWTFDLLADYTLRSDGIDQIFGGSGVRRRF